MATKIVTKNSSTAGAAPTATDLVQGELAVNVADKRLFTEDNGGAIVELGTNPYNFTANHNGSAKLATTSTGIDVTGTMTADGVQVGNTSDAYSAVFITTSTTGESELRMGDTDTDAGSIAYTNSDDTMTFRAAAGARMTLDSTGIDVTGTATMDGLTVEGSSSGLANFYRASANANFGAITFKDTTNTNVNAQIGWNSNELRLDGTNSVRLVTDAKNRLLASSGGDISFYEDTGTTAKFFWDASAESLGIGTSSPKTSLDIASSTGPQLTLTRTDSLNDLGDTLGRINFYNSDLSGDGANNAAIIEAIASSGTGAHADLLFRTKNTGVDGGDATEAMRIDSSGITTFKYNTKVYTAGYPETRLGISDSNYFNFTFDNPSDALSIGKNGSTKMTLTASGNLLVGTTDGIIWNEAATDASKEGVVIEPKSIQISRFQDTPLLINRQGNDGDIAVFAKDGTAVGSIGYNSGNGFYMHTPFGNDSGLVFGSERIVPCTSTGAFDDAVVDLGYSSGRFKDLYLSGGVYLGGTGAANKLDDYEEGTWTPTIIGSTSGTATLTVSGSSYTKIGNTVRVDCFITAADVTGISGAVRLAGLPFGASGYTPITLTYCNLFNFNEADGVGGFVESGNTYVNLVYGSSKLLIQSVSADATNGTAMFTLVYKTNA